MRKKERRTPGKNRKYSHHSSLLLGEEGRCKEEVEVGELGMFDISIPGHKTKEINESQSLVRES
jgi:hypothetical protein